MSTRHTHRSGLTLHLHDGGEYEFTVVTGFTFTPGEPERGPSYASGGEPASGPEVEIDSVRMFDANKREHAALAHTVWKLVETDDAILERLIETAAEDDAAAHDEAAERHAEDRGART